MATTTEVMQWTIEQVEEWDRAQQKGAKVLLWERIPEPHRRESNPTMEPKIARIFRAGVRCAAALPRATAVGGLFWARCLGRVRTGAGIFCRVHRGGRRRSGKSKCQ